MAAAFRPAVRAPDLPRARVGGDLVDRSERVAASADAMWREIFEREGLDYDKPGVEVYSGTADSICEGGTGDDDDFLAFYCFWEKRIYLSEMGAIGLSNADWAYVVAHEVGHHVQQLRGTVGTFDGQRPAHELQADCYAGVWGASAGLRPPSGDFFTEDPDTHGTAAQQREWLMRGYRTRRPAMCSAPIGSRGR